MMGTSPSVSGSLSIHNVEIGAHAARVADYTQGILHLDHGSSNGVRVTRIGAGPAFRDHQGEQRDFSVPV
jgi:hypothetical protein